MRVIEQRDAPTVCRKGGEGLATAMDKQTHGVAAGKEQRNRVSQSMHSATLKFMMTFVAPLACNTMHSRK